MLFVDIVKGSPNYALNYFFSNTITDGADVQTSDFLAQVVLTTPSFARHSFTTNAAALAFAQSAGTLDAINIAWSLDYIKVHICDLAAVVIA